MRRLFLTRYFWEQFLGRCYFWQQPRLWYKVFADDVKIGEGAKNEELICQCGQKELIQSSDA